MSEYKHIESVLRMSFLMSFTLINVRKHKQSFTDLTYRTTTIKRSINPTNRLYLLTSPLTGMSCPLCQRVLRVLRAVPHHRVRHSSQPERVLGLYIRGDHGAAGLRAVGRRDGQHYHRHDPGQHVRRHVAVGHQPQRSVPGEPGDGERGAARRTLNVFQFGFVPHSSPVVFCRAVASLWNSAVTSCERFPSA